MEFFLDVNPSFELLFGHSDNKLLKINEPSAQHSIYQSRQASARGGYCGVCRGGQSDYAVAVY